MQENMHSKDMLKPQIMQKTGPFARIAEYIYALYDARCINAYANQAVNNHF